MHNLNSIPLSALRTIEAIARTGTLASAAHELGVTPGALSQRLSKAEEALGRTMFVRGAKGLTPTEICAEVLPRLTRAIDDLSGVVSDIREVDSTVLTVSVAPLFASRWLVWRIQKFNADNPSISIRVLPTVDVVDLDRSDVDVGLRVGSDPALGNGAVKLLDQRVFPVCSADIAQRIKSPADMLKYPVIRENEDMYGWASWLAEMGVPYPQLPPGPTYADAALCLDAAMTGQGIFMAWETLACDALERGQVVSPFKPRAATGSTYWFVTSRNAARKPSVRKFRTWLQEELERSVRNWRTGVDFDE